MAKGLISFLCVLAGGLLVTAEIPNEIDVQETELRMPQVQPDKGDQYLCTAMELDRDNEHYLVGFTPHGSMHTAHHMLLFGCTAPGSEKAVWNCGEMSDDSNGEGQFEQAPVCQDGASIIYAWALDAKELKLPKGVGFKVGGRSPFQYLILQVHYMHPMEHPDTSGLTLTSTEEVMPRRAGTLLMVTGGRLPAKKTEHFETACEIDEPVTLHPFAFRTHTHKHGKAVSGWVVEKDQKGENQWSLIGRMSPQKPQMFYDTPNKDLTVEPGAVVAARCTMVNDEDRDVYVGSTGADEMCNFYMMYYVDGDRILSDNTCYSPGPPDYYWERDGGLNHVPEKEASSLN